MREIVRRLFQRAQGREVGAQLRVQELEEALGPREIAQPHAAQVAQRRLFGQPRTEQLANALRQQHLAAMRGGHDARRAVDRGAVVVVVAPFRDARVQAAACAQRQAAHPLELGERALQLHRGADGIEWIAEGRVQPVARLLHDVPAVPFHRLARERVVARHRRAHPIGLLLPEAGAALDVGEKERRGAGRLVQRGPRRGEGWMNTLID